MTGFSLLSEMAAHGIQANVWTVNSLSLMKQMLRLPIHAVMTDDPRLYWQALDEIKEGSCV